MEERSKPDLYGILEESFWEGNFLWGRLIPKVLKISCVNVYEELIFRGKLCKSKCIHKFVSSLVHKIPVRALFQANFGLMTSPSWNKTSKILRESVHKWIILLTVSQYLLLFINLSTVAYEIQIWTFLTHLWVGDVTTRSQNFTILR